MINKLSLLIIVGVGIYYASMFMTPTATTCAELSAVPPLVTFIDNESEAVYNLGVGRKQLGSLKQKHDRQFSRFKVAGQTLGLTTGRYKYTMSMSSGFQKVSPWGRGYCPYVRQISIELNYDSEVYVAKEYVPNKCAFDVILGHELNHHQVNVMNKRKYTKWLKADLPAVIGSLTQSYEPVSQKMLKITNQKMQRDIEYALNVYLHKMNSRMEVENQKLDTRAEYRRLNKEIRACYRRKS